MIHIALLGKDEILEKVRWCRKYSGQSRPDEFNKDALLEIKQNFDVMSVLTNPALDANQVGQKIIDLGIKIPTNDEYELTNSILVQDFSIYVTFCLLELVPGRPDYEYGIGIKMETYNIFFEDRLYKTVEVTQTKKKMAGLMREKITTKEKKIKTIPDLFGPQFTDPNYYMAVVGKGKDNRENIRLSLRVCHNLSFAGKNLYRPANLNYRWKGEAEFFKTLNLACENLGALISSVYTAVGYDESPEFTLFMGDFATDRPVNGFAEEKSEHGLILVPQYPLSS